MTKYEEISEAIDALNNTRRRLKELGVFRSKKWHSEFGEWLVSELLDGARALSSTQRGWDVQAGEKTYQVKTHFLPCGDANRYNDMGKGNLQFDELVILGLNDFMKVTDVFKLTQQQVDARLSRRKQSLIYWSQLEDVRWDVSSLPTYTHLQRFFAFA